MASNQVLIQNKENDLTAHPPQAMILLRQKESVSYPPGGTWHNLEETFLY